MKRTLKLKKETVRQLSGNELSGVVGGLRNSDSNDTANSADCTTNTCTGYACSGCACPASGGAYTCPHPTR